MTYSLKRSVLKKKSLSTKCSFFADFLCYILGAFSWSVNILCSTPVTDKDLGQYAYLQTF